MSIPPEIKTQAISMLGQEIALLNAKDEMWGK